MLLVKIKIKSPPVTIPDAKLSFSISKPTSQTHDDAVNIAAARR